SPTPLCTLALHDALPICSGPFSLTGQPNAMGGRETGSLSNLLPGHREAANPDHRAEVARYWGVEALPANPGLTAIDLFDAVHDRSEEHTSELQSRENLVC